MRQSRRKAQEPMCPMVIGQSIQRQAPPLMATSQLYRNMSTDKPSVNRRSNSGKLRTFTPDREKEKESPVKGQLMETIIEKPPKKKKKEIVKKRKENYQVCLKQIKPLNLQKEKQTFFSMKGNYSPFFLYNNIAEITEHDKEYKGMEKPHDKYLSLAIKILQKAVKVDYVRRLAESPLLTMEQTSQHFNSYIQYLQIAQLISYEFMENTVAPTSVIHNNTDGISRVVVGLPIQYRRISILGVLNHEIGTHFIRKFNNRLQKWHKQRKKYALQPHLKHEQGLAAVNQLFSIATTNILPPLMYQAALHYYSCYQASRMSFAELFNDLQKYHSEPEMRWRECVRVKRGIADTGRQQGMYKDQIYLRGAIRILKHRKELNFIDLHCGKLTVKDCLRLSQKKQINYVGTKMPYFLKNLDDYKRALDRIAQENMIDEWLSK